ncbi:MAG: isopeptide-forming domain-containing fimbrial protein [Eubacterium sp.]|nr:isopeptide-forming domain-containing fimbrial protein [Eubacterium sp.]
MKKMKKIFALLIAMVMVFGMSTTVFAASTIYKGAYDDSEGATNTEWDGAGPASIKITLPTTQVAPTGTTTYEIYKVFDATNNGTSSAISYTIMSGKSGVPGTTFIADINGTVYHYDPTATVTADTEGAIQITLTGGSKRYIVPTGGTLTEAEVAAIASYIGSDAPVCTAVVPAGDASVTISGLDYGYYYIATSTGTVVTVDSTNPSAEVKDKNVIPPVVKSAGTAYNADSLKAIAAVGTSQPFTAQITKTHGAKNLVFTDTMTNMLFDGTVNITVSSGTAPTTAQAKVETTATGFTVTFDNDYIAGLADNTIITLKYSGTITSDALSVNPATNTATLTSGEGNTSTSATVNVYNAKFTVTKQDGSGQPLPDAGFVIKNNAGAYYKLNAATEAVEDDPTTEGVDESADATPASITWYTLAANETLEQAISDGKITQYISNAQGTVPAFTGLANGTYTLVESTVPNGYNKAADSTFTIADNNYDRANLEQTATVVNQAGSVLPSTGGIGTKMFYIIGAVIVAGAAIALVARRRVRK